MSELEEALLLEITAAGLPDPVREYKFHPKRKWRADFCWTQERVIVEVNGGTHQRMGHSTGRGIHRDYEKVNAAQLMGYTCLQVDREMIESGEAVKMIDLCLKRGEL